MPPPGAAATPNSVLSSSDRDPAPWARRLSLLLLLAACVAIRMVSLADKPLWFDECFSVEVARISWGNFLRLLWWREANMSLYYLLLRMWLHFGQSEAFIRSLSVSVAAATLPAIYWVGRLLYDRRVGLIAAALFTFNAFSVRYAQEARSYALFLLLATLSSGLLIRFLRVPERRNRIAYIVVSILAVYAHFYALLLLAVHWIALRWFCPTQVADDLPLTLPPKMLRTWLAVGAGVLPLLIFVAKTGAGPIRWIQRPGLRDVIEFYEHLAGSARWPLLAICAVASLAAVLPVGTRLLVRKQNWEVWRCQFLLLWLMFPVVLTVMLSYARPVFLGRYMIFCLPPLLILTAAGLAQLRKSWLLSGALTAILLLGAQGVLFVYGHDFDNERDASGAASNFLLDHSQPGDAAIFHIAETRIPYEFFRSVRAGENTASPRFAAQLGPEILFPHHGAGLDYRDFTGKPTRDFLREVAPAYPRVWIMLMNNGPTGSPDPTTVMLTEVLPESFPKVQKWQFPKVEVRLYSK